MNKKGVAWAQLLPAILLVFVLLVSIFIILEGTAYGRPFEYIRKSLGLGGEKGEESVETTLEKIRESTVIKPGVSTLNTKADKEYKKGNWNGALELYEESYSKQKDEEVKKKLIELLKEKAAFYEKDEDFASAKEAYLKLKNLGENVDAKLSYVNVELNKPPKKHTDVEYDECKDIRSFTKRHECAAEDYADQEIFIGKGYSPEQASEHERSVILRKYEEDANKFAQATLLKQYKILADNLMKKHYSAYEEGQKNKRYAYAIYYALSDKFWRDDEVISKLREGYTNDKFNYLEISFSKVNFGLSLKSYVWGSPYAESRAFLWKPKEFFSSISRGEEKINKFVVRVSDLRKTGSPGMLPEGVYAPRDEGDIKCIGIKTVSALRGGGWLGPSEYPLEVTYEARDILGQSLCRGVYYATHEGPYMEFNERCIRYFKMDGYTQITCDKKGDEEWIEFKVKGDYMNLQDSSDNLDWLIWDVPHLNRKWE